MKILEKLTEGQKKLVSDNHDLIDFFINIKKLQKDDYYYVLAEALCKAAKNYNKDLSAFRTYAMYAMNTALKNTIRKNNQATTIPETITISTSKNIGLADERMTISDMLKYPNVADVDDRVVLKVSIEQCIKNLTNREKEIVDLLDRGYTRKQVAEALSTDKRNIGVHSVGLYIKKIRRKMRPYVY